MNEGEVRSRLELLENQAEKVKSLLYAIKRQGQQYSELWQAFRRNLTPLEVILGTAGIVTKYDYRFAFPVTQASQAIDRVTKTIFPDTTYMLLRLSAHWLPTTGAGAARWWAPASSNPVVLAAIQAGAAIDVPDFFYQIQDLASGRWLSDEPLPGDWLYRQDRDGYISEYPSVFYGKNQVVIEPTLTRAASVSGTLYIVMHGLQAVRAPKADVT